MSETGTRKYEFERLPIEPVDPGTNLLVTGPTMGGLRTLLVQLLSCEPGEGMLLLSTDVDGPSAIGDYESAGCTYDDSRMAVVDCTLNSREDESRNIYTVSAPGDLTGMGIVFSSLYERLYDAGTSRVRTGLYTLSTLLMYTEEIQPLYRFLHTLTGRIRTADGLGVSAIDPETQDEQTVHSLSQPFDAELQLREKGDDRQLRIRGLDGQPSGWQPLDLRD